MAEGSPLDRVPETDRTGATQPVQPGKSQPGPESGKFAEHMRPKEEMATQAQQASPMQAAAQSQISKPGVPPTMESLQGQINTTSSRLGDIKTQLHTKNLKLKQSEKHLLNKKLKQASDHLRSTHKHLGGNPGPAPDLKKTKNPVNKFLSMVADGQHQLNSAATQLRNLNTSGHQMNAGQMMLIQVKLQKAQQELDYTSVLLGKAVEMMRTLLNVQI